MSSCYNLQGKSCHHLYVNYFQHLHQFEISTGMQKLPGRFRGSVSNLEFDVVFAHVIIFNDSSLLHPRSRLVHLSKSEEMKQENFEPCFRRIGRLYGELGSHKEFMTKFSPYAISGYIKICSTESIPVLYKGLLDEGIYVIFDTCTDVELSMMSTSFENADREHFRQLRTFYERHHKFHGKT
uniref:Nucleolar 27S pre-rRNA processing Urb2/Npa2 C-terminal domain-containing protein n=1 Tax=Clytia hemisphaerica TaxID=252671 RepID=A0A7M5V6W8_9CNID